MELVALAQTDRLYLGDRFEARVYFKPSFFGSYEEDRASILKQIKEIQTDSSQPLSKTKLLGSRIVVQPGPSDTRQEPYLALELEVIKNPPPLVVGALVLSLGYVLHLAGVLAIAIAAIVFFVWIAKKSGVLGSIYILAGLAIVAIFFWRGNPLPKALGG